MGTDSCVLVFVNEDQKHVVGGEIRFWMNGLLHYGLDELHDGSLEKTDEIMIFFILSRTSIDPSLGFVN